MAMLPPVPINSPVLEHADSDPARKEPFRAKLYRDMVRFLTLLRDAASAASQFVSPVALSEQSASIASTDIATLPAGLYRVSYSLRITQAASVSSSAQPSFSWTSHSVSCTQSFAALTTNTTASQSSGQLIVNVDAGTPITYAVTYASAGATPMQYAFNVFTEDLPE